MPKEEIIGGLQNAIARGQPLEKAIQSFINAGYNSTEVQAAASIVSSGASNFVQQSPQIQNQTLQNTSSQLGLQSQEVQIPSAPQPTTLPKRKTGKGKIILLSIALIILLIGLIVTIFFKDKIIALF